MSEGKQRSSIFKFFYIILRVITFPIYIVIYILRNPLWVLFFVLLGVGVLAYYPMSKGVHSSDIIKWYKDKYIEVKYDVVKTVVEKTDGTLVPESLVNEVKKEQQKIAEEKEEASRFKGENYNTKVVREDEFEDIANTIKKRGGFKKKNVEVENNAEENVNNTEANAVGGLSNILKKIETSEAEIEEKTDVEVLKNDEVVQSGEENVSVDEEKTASHDVVEINEAAPVVVEQKADNTDEPQTTIEDELDLL